MGFFSKVFKGVKKVFKKVGKAIKSGLKSVGKFMDKIGIVGQIGLSLLLPGIGQALGGMWQGLVGTMQGYTGVGSSVIQGAGNFLAKATEIASGAGRAFSSITEGVKNVVGETLKAGANALGVDTALIETGKSLGSEYLQNLGESISKANFDSIGAQFGKSAEAVVNSFSGVVPADSPLLTDGAVTPQPENIYDPDIVTPDMPLSNAQELSFDAQYNPDFRPDELAALRGEPLPALTTEQEAFSAARNQALTDLPSVGEQQSLLGKAYDETISRGRQFISDAPSKAYAAVERGIESSVVTGVRRATGVEQAPEYETTYYGTYVPQLDFSDTSIAAPSAQFNPVQFASANTELMNMYPFGATAQLYNDATYGTQMRQYGYA